MLHISELEIAFNIFTGPTLKEPSKQRLMTMKEIETDQDPNQDDGDYESK